MYKYLEKENEISFDKIFNQILGKLKLKKKKTISTPLQPDDKHLISFLFECLTKTLSGYLLFKDFCENASEEPVPHLKFYEEVSESRKCAI